MCTCLALTPVLECWQHCPFPEQHQVFWGFPTPYSICSSSGPWPHEIMYISYLMLLFPLWQYMIQGVLTSRKFIWSSASMVCVTFWKWHNFWRCILKDILFIKKSMKVLSTWPFFLHLKCLNFKIFFLSWKTKMFFNGEIDVLESHVIKTWIVIYLNAKRNLELQVSLSSEIYK